jgi:hypothetical protein
VIDDGETWEVNVGVANTPTGKDGSAPPAPPGVAEPAGRGPNPVRANRPNPDTRTRTTFKAMTMTWSLRVTPFLRGDALP